MLTRIRLGNFKCFDELELPTRPLTLLTGFNAAGKSTALQPILLLAQSLRTGRTGRSLPLNGELVALGTPQEVLSDRGSGNGRITIGAACEGADATWLLRADDRSAGSALAVERVEFGGGGEAPTNLPCLGACDWGRLAGARLALAEFLRDVVYLSAVREPTTDAFPVDESVDRVPADVGVRGEYAAWLLARHDDEEVTVARLHPAERAPTLRRQLNAWLGELFPGADANAVRVPRTSLVRLELRTGTTSDYRRPANIGYGLGYALPVVVALLLARDGQTVVIDSPEAHLHPRGQSAMGRLLALFASAGVQVLVETHSDHVLNGVRLAVNAGRLPGRDAAAHFFLRRDGADEPGSRVVSPAFSSDGRLSEWPEGFFDQADQDLSRLAGWS